MKLSKKLAAEIQLAIDDAAEAQTRFWDALRELESLTHREFDASSDMGGMSVDNFFTSVPDFKAQYDKLIAARELGLPCTCAERSWYGEEHDSACERTGKR